MTRFVVMAAAASTIAGAVAVGVYRAPVGWAVLLSVLVGAGGIGAGTWIARRMGPRIEPAGQVAGWQVVVDRWRHEILVLVFTGLFAGIVAHNMYGASVTVRWVALSVLVGIAGALPGCVVEPTRPAALTRSPPAGDGAT